MSRIDAVIIILVCSIIGFILGMTVPEPAFQVSQGLIWAIIATGIGTITCVVFNHITSTKEEKDT